MRSSAHKLQPLTVVVLPRYKNHHSLSATLNNLSRTDQPKWLSRKNHLDQFLSRAIVSGLLFYGPNPTQVWNTLLHSLARSPSPNLSISLYHLLHRQGIFAPDSYTLTSLLKAIARISDPKKLGGEQLHSLTLKLGLDSDTFVLNSLIHMYSACGLVGAARLVFHSAPDSVLDVVSWNTMISGYLHSNLYKESLLVFKRMVESLVPMDVITPVSALIACGKIGALSLGKMIHGLIVVIGFHINFYLGSSLISMYAKCGSVQDARKLFDYMPDRNMVCWASMVTGYAYSGRFRDSVQLFRDMQAAGVRLDDATIASVISSCAQLGALDQGSYVHAYCNANSIGMSLSVNNALIDMYSKCGDIKRALQIFQRLVQPDVFSWTTMISGLAMNGHPIEALELFSKMEVLGAVMPNEVTFLGVLLACSHGGLVEDGYRNFYCMTSVYKLTPKIEHYGCMVDLLGRAKLVVEAVRFIEEMPIEPDVVIWRSLLFACRANGDVNLAEYAAERVMEFEPTKCGGHVLLSNVYAVASRWKDVKRVRGFMYDSSIQKQPGCSFIEVNGVVHEFIVGDGSHEQSKAIHGVLLGINRLLFSETYSTDTLGLFGVKHEGEEIML